VDRKGRDRDGRKFKFMNGFPGGTYGVADPTKVGSEIEENLRKAGFLGRQ
jgi:hypothetical protein